MAVTPLCTVSDVTGAWPAFSSISSSEQTSLIGVASEKIVKFCRRGDFGQATQTELYDGNNLERIWLIRRPVIAVNSITINGDPVDNSSGEEWGFNAKTGELWRHLGYRDGRFGRKFPAGRQNIAVSYFAGYQAIPYEVNRAAIFMVKYLSEQFKASGVYSAERIGDYNYTLNTTPSTMGIPRQVADLLVDYVQDDAFA